MKHYSYIEILAMPVEQYGSMHTRQLLNVFRQAKRWYSRLCHYDEHSDKDGVELGKRIPLMKKELDTREHVPGKLESREKRKARIKKGQ